MVSVLVARELNVSRAASTKWQRADLITPQFSTPGGHHRRDPEKVREQLRALRQSEFSASTPVTGRV
jgi:hypothetical protein